MKILYLSIYPLLPLTHGGQIRQKAIYDHLRSMGHELLHIAITDHSYTCEAERCLILSSDKLTPYIRSPFALDLAIADYCKEAREPLHFLEKKLHRFQPDLIMLEQPWLWPLIKRLDLKTPIVYSSQNVEYETKSHILDTAHDPIVQDIYRLEMDLLQNAAACIAVTQSDIDTFQKLVPTLSYYLAPNGTHPKVTPVETYHTLAERYASIQIIFFAASAYPPNARGFWRSVGDLLWLPYDTRILIAGSVCENLFDHMPDPLYEEVARVKIELLGFVDEATLYALYDIADLLILPIHTGGGSNLKTAEAIAACKPIVATPFAMRGYEWAKELDALGLASSKEEFVDLTLRYLFAPPAIKDMKKREAVFWYNCLESLERMLKKLP